MRGSLTPWVTRSTNTDIAFSRCRAVFIFEWKIFQTGFPRRLPNSCVLHLLHFYDRRRTNKFKIPSSIIPFPPVPYRKWLSVNFITHFSNISLSLSSSSFPTAGEHLTTTFTVHVKYLKSTSKIKNYFYFFQLNIVLKFTIT